HTDAQGRIKVQFHWQRPDEHPTIGAGLDDKSSCWLRVAMPSAGAGWGHQFIPRIGQEVLVDFIEGDIDRPVITGVLYNGSHPTPDFSGAGSLPANKTLSGIKSKEHQGGGYNELLFDDTAAGRGRRGWRRGCRCAARSRRRAAGLCRCCADGRGSPG
ncbi:type VI secretion system tip protein VgrG, partial [Chromobacterium vaccinii]